MQNHVETVSAPTTSRTTHQTSATTKPQQTALAQSPTPYDAPSEITPSLPAKVVSLKNELKSQKAQSTADQQQQQTQRPAQVADHRLASSTITGEYGSTAAVRQGEPRVGGYLTAKA